ncbi:unnamed protein product [Moneuplotes crassus]|uniref:Uncharacterized protein n=1 Tax=Euplotes crassus TaxID=5936 RepID=A0AAD1UMQ7_EUPCR|nr:unnamed protein product [Moneuplotes crassus]
MENADQLEQINKTRILERENLVEAESNRVDKILRNAYYFMCFKHVLEYENCSLHRMLKVNPLEISLDYSKRENRNYAKKNKFLGSFQIDRFQFFQSKMRNKHVVNFINSSYPNKVARFDICCGADSYFTPLHLPNSLMKVRCNVLDELCIYNFVISTYQFKRIMASYKHVGKISILMCDISISSEFDFSQALRNTKIKVLDFECSIYKADSWFIEDSGEFNIFIDGLASSSDLMTSLERISFKSCEIEQDKITKILNLNGFNNILIDL